MANAAWTPRDWFSLDAGYSKIHLDTVGGINFFAAVPRADPGIGSRFDRT